MSVNVVTAFNMSIEWEVSQGDCSKCNECNEPIYGTMYQMAVAVNQYTAWSDIKLCGSCYNEAIVE